MVCIKEQNSPGLLFINDITLFSSFHEPYDMAHIDTETFLFGYVYRKTNRNTLRNALRILLKSNPY